MVRVLSLGLVTGTRYHGHRELVSFLLHELGSRGPETGTNRMSFISFSDRIEPGAFISHSSFVKWN